MRGYNPSYPFIMPFIGAPQPQLPLYYRPFIGVSLLTPFGTGLRLGAGFGVSADVFSPRD